MSSMGAGTLWGASGVRVATTSAGNSDTGRSSFAPAREAALAIRSRAVESAASVGRVPCDMTVRPPRGSLVDPSTLRGGRREGQAAAAWALAPPERLRGPPAVAPPGAPRPALLHLLVEPQRAECDEQRREPDQRQRLRPQLGEPHALEHDAADDDQ